MKFVKAKEPVVTTSAIEKVKSEKTPKVIAQWVSTKPPNLAMAKLNSFVTIVESKVTLDPIATSFGH